MGNGIWPPEPQNASRRLFDVYRKTIPLSVLRLGLGCHRPIWILYMMTSGNPVQTLWGCWLIKWNLMIKNSWDIQKQIYFKENIRILKQFWRKHLKRFWRFSANFHLIWQILSGGVESVLTQRASSLIRRHKAQPVGPLSPLSLHHRPAKRFVISPRPICAFKSPPTRSFYIKLKQEFEDKFVPKIRGGI